MRFVLFVLGTLFALASVSRAEDCHLERAASLDMVVTPGGAILVPASIGDRKLYLRVDTAAAFSTISHRLVEALGLTTENLEKWRVYNGAGEEFKSTTHIRDLHIGALNAAGFNFLVGLKGGESTPAATAEGTPEAEGVLGTDILSRFDIDLDFVGKKIALVSPDHCPGQVVYWSNSYFTLPFDYTLSSHIHIPVKLDDKDAKAILDTGSSRSTVDLSWAHRQLNLEPGTAGVEEIEKVHSDSGKTFPEYLHRFSTFDFGPLQFRNVPMALFGFKQPVQEKSDFVEPSLYKETYDTLLGVHELQRLHLYIAYKERTLYFTLPEAPESK